MNSRAELPIDRFLDAIAASLRLHRNLVIEAEPGAGKTTRVPTLLLEQLTGEVIVLEPRRIAARLAARRVSSEIGERVGETVGYQVRFEEQAGPKTRLRYVTEGVLTRRLMSNPELKGVSAVVFDEFHERHIEGDLALALLKRLQQSRHDLKLIVMSATLDTAPVSRYLMDCPIVRVPGRTFPLQISHLPYFADVLERRVAGAVERLMSQGQRGDILVFLPGMGEIRQSMRECDPISRRYDLLVLPFHGDLSPAEQDLAVSPSEKQKIILATNIAESSVTLDGVTAVIDSGLARFASYSHWTGFSTLQVGRISKSSADQRAGRAGRTAPGKVLRLYTEADYAMRPQHDLPQILRSDLSQVCLMLRAMGIENSRPIQWLDPPSEAAVQNAEELLLELEATGDVARRMAAYPLPPRLAKILIEGVARGVGEDACVAAAVLSSGTRFQQNDLLQAMDVTPDKNLSQAISQLRRIAKPLKQSRQDDDALLRSVLSGFPDRVARRRFGNVVSLSTGGSAEIAGAAPAYEFMVAVDAEERGEQRQPLVRMTSRIEPEWLIDLFPEKVRERTRTQWNDGAERVEAISEIVYGELVLQASSAIAVDERLASEMLVRKALEAGIERLVDPTTLTNFQSRVEFAGLAAPSIEEALTTFCFGLRSFHELKRATADFVAFLEQEMEVHHLRELAPKSVRLQNGRTIKVHYEQGKPPWIASRLQDFFGMRDTPRIGRNQRPIVIHLLAPNYRSVQTTTDLAGFWERLYPQVRRELMRRYPKHAWPEQP